MEEDITRPGNFEDDVLANAGNVYWGLRAPQLYEHAIRAKEGILSEHGALVVRTGPTTGRSPNDRFIVLDETTESRINWALAFNRPISPENYWKLYDLVSGYVHGRDMYVQDLHVGADPHHRLPVRVFTEYAWQSLFARNMFAAVNDAEQAEQFEPRFQVIAVPRLSAHPPEAFGIDSETFIVLNYKERTILIGASWYGGEIKKGIFTVMNYLMPDDGVLPMHCSASVGQRGDVALFFGLSATGKTTLSADRSRALIGDDQHGWGPNGVFNFENGCYAKIIDLSPEDEPEILACTKQFRTIMENVGIDLQTRQVDLSDDSITPNTRASYPLSHLDNIVTERRAGHPDNIIFLTCDAFGVMPPIAKLSTEQAEYHFLSGYTAKVAGTEVGITEPEPEFSACFGAPFMVLQPPVYADMLAERVNNHNVDCWLLNTGWTGGPFGEGHRIEIGVTRRLLRAAVDGELDGVPVREEPFFGLRVPRQCPDVDPDLLNPRETWRDPGAYDERAKKLCARFRQNFEKFEDKVSEDVLNAGPNC